eukprot:scpid64132/ scgid33653/ Suppressor of cytokine signaling 6
MERLVAMSRDSSESEAHRRSGHGHRRLFDSPRCLPFATRGESSSASEPAATIQRYVEPIAAASDGTLAGVEAPYDQVRLDGAPYAQVRLTEIRYGQQSVGAAEVPYDRVRLEDAGSTSARASPESQNISSGGEQNSSKQSKPTLLYRLARRVRHHSSHPQIHFANEQDRRDSGNVNGGATRQMPPLKKPLRVSKSLENVLVMPQEFGTGIAFVMHTEEPGSRRVKSSDQLFQHDRADAGRSASANEMRQQSSDEATLLANGEELPPALPARLYLDGPEEADNEQDTGEAGTLGDGTPGQQQATVDIPAFVPPLPGEEEPVENQPSKLWLDMLALNKCGYYWGPINEDTAVEVLTDKSEGTFLVHDSSNLHHLYSVSAVVNGQVEHFPINMFDNQAGYTFYNPAELPRHPTPDEIAWGTMQSTIPDLIAWAQALTRDQHHRRGVRPFLIKPLNHMYVVPSLQDMCRTTLRKDMRLSEQHVRQLPLPAIVQTYLLAFSFF